MPLIPILLEVGNDDDDASRLLVVADCTKEIGQGDGCPLGETSALFFVAFRARMDEVERKLIEQDQDALVLHQRRPLLFRRSGILLKIRAKSLAQSNPDVLVGIATGEGDDMIRGNAFRSLLEGPSSRELGKASKQTADDHALRLAASHGFRKLENAPARPTGETVKSLSDQLLHAEVRTFASRNSLASASVSS